jgi:hypothetical protein
MKHRDIPQKNDPMPFLLYENGRLAGICAPGRMTQDDRRLFLNAMCLPPLARRRIGVCPRVDGRVHWHAYDQQD